MRIPSGSTTEFIYFVAVSTTDYVTRVTDLTSFVCVQSVNGSTGTALTTPHATVVNSVQMPGIYKLPLKDSTVMTLPAGVDSREVCLHITSSMAPVTRTVEVYRRTATTGQTLALNTSGKIADVESILSKATSIESNTTGLVTKLTSVETDVDAVLTKLTSVETDVDTALNNLSTVLTKVTSIDTDIDTALSKLTSIESNTTGLVTKLTSVETDVDSVLTKLTSVESDVDGVVTKLTSVETDVDAILADTGTDGVVVATVSTAAGNSIADQVLDRDMATGTDSGSSTVRTARQALRFMRNRWVISGGNLTVYKEDDTTSSWTAAVTTDAGADPIVESNPVGP